MDLTNSLLRDLVTEYSDLRPQIYFKSSLIALARAMQDLVLADNGSTIVIANFQQERLFRQQAKRFQRMAIKSPHIYVLGVPEIDSGFALADSDYETIPIKPTDTLAGERYLVVIGQYYSACFAVREKLSISDLRNADLSKRIEEGTRFEGIWSFKRDISYSAADWLLGMIANYRPELKEKTEQARKLFKLSRDRANQSLLSTQSVDLDIFAQRLVTYLQSGQYKLLKAYQAISTAEKRESLINQIGVAQRNSLNPEEILATTVTELSKLFPNCRCLLYPLEANDTEVTIKYEAKPSFMATLVGQTWSIAQNPLFLAAQAQKSTLAIENVKENAYLYNNPVLKDKINRGNIGSWLIVSIRYQGQLLGMLELHYGGDKSYQWKPNDIALLEAISTSAGAALTQAMAYTNLVKLNQKLESVERTQSNLIAIVGHELRTPLSTIRVCLESLITEPDMARDLKEIMLDTALSDTERLGQLIQNFLTLSRLEEGSQYSNIRNIESLTIDYALNLALRSIRNKLKEDNIPQIKIDLPANLPPIRADVDGLVEVFFKLLENACKFTLPEGEIIVSAKLQSNMSQNQEPDSSSMLEIMVADTGRGIARNQLEMIFKRFSQSESYLRRTVNGAGLGLVICRKIIQGMKGNIWAESEGINRGSQFYFTLPIDK